MAKSGFIDFSPSVDIINKFNPKGGKDENYYFTGNENDS